MLIDFFDRHSELWLLSVQSLELAWVLLVLKEGRTEDLGLIVFRDASQLETLYVTVAWSYVIGRGNLLVLGLGSNLLFLIVVIYNIQRSRFVDHRLWLGFWLLLWFFCRYVNCY